MVLADEHVRCRLAIASVTNRTLYFDLYLDAEHFDRNCHYSGLGSFVNIAEAEPPTPWSGSRKMFPCQSFTGMTLSLRHHPENIVLLEKCHKGG